MDVSIIQHTGGYQMGMASLTGRYSRCYGPTERALRIVMLSCQSHAMYGELFVNSSTGVRIQFV